MKWCVQFPEETILLVRPCLVAICMGNRPAAKLLSVLLYLYSIREENRPDAENLNEAKRLRGKKADQDTSHSIHRKQSQLVELMCGEITEKTLHDIAVPWLQLLGYLDLEEDLKSNRYILHIDRIKNALNRYDPSKQLTPELEKFLIENFQLEKFLITSDEIKEAIANKKNFLSQLEKVLIRNRNISNCQRGRKPNPEARLKGNSKKPRLDKELIEKERTLQDTLSELDSPTLSPSECLPKEKQSDTGSHIANLTIEPKTPSQVPSEPPVRSISDYSEAQLRKLSEIELHALLTPKQKEILARWRSLFNAPIKLDGKLARALHDLEPYDPSAETIEQIRKYCFSVDRSTEKFPKGYYKTKGVKLWDIVEHYANWLQTQEVITIQASKAAESLTVADLTKRSLRTMKRL